ncbi:MAG: hypothetical protein ABIH82_00065 [Candidatus Woesearchaeota archaeon]
MTNLVVYNERIVDFKGLCKDYQINEEMLKEYFFDGDKEKLNLLNFTLNLNVDKPTLFYPGCGVDILYPLFFLEKVFPKLSEIKLIFNDIDNNLGIIKTILDDIGVSFSGNETELKFYWKNILIDLEFLRGNVFSMNLPHFDLYFERAFRIMKDQDLRYEFRIYERLNQKGILISDSGFERFELEKLKVPLELSSYGEMVIGKKK